MVLLTLTNTLKNSSNTSPCSICLYKWDLVCDRRGKNKATATIFFVGVMLGAIAFGSLSDRYDSGHLTHTCDYEAIKILNLEPC